MPTGHSWSSRNILLWNYLTMMMVTTIKRISQSQHLFRLCRNIFQLLSDPPILITKSKYTFLDGLSIHFQTQFTRSTILQPSHLHQVQVHRHLQDRYLQQSQLHRLLPRDLMDACESLLKEKLNQMPVPRSLFLWHRTNCM